MEQRKGDNLEGEDFRNGSTHCQCVFSCMYIYPLTSRHAGVILYNNLCFSCDH